jgi:hypothetical protein
VEDTLSGATRHTLRLSWHLGPEVSVELAEGVAELSWSGDSGPCSGRLSLPGQLSWSAHRGQTRPVLGWYSPRFGGRVPSTTLVGSGTWTGRLVLRTVLDLSALAAARAAVSVGDPAHASGGSRQQASRQGDP